MVFREVKTTMLKYLKGWTEWFPLSNVYKNVWQGESLSPNLNVTRRLMCISYIEKESRNTSRKFTQNALPWLDLYGFEVFIFVRGSRQNQKQSITHNYFCPRTVKLLNTVCIWQVTTASVSLANCLFTKQCDTPFDSKFCDLFYPFTVSKRRLTDLLIRSTQLKLTCRLLAVCTWEGKLGSINTQDI